MIQKPSLQNASKIVMDQVEMILKNMDKEIQNATIQHLQTKWFKARTEMIGKPAPQLSLSDALTGERFNIKTKKERLYLYSFSA
jgi:hypothetical protein